MAGLWNYVWRILQTNMGEVWAVLDVEKSKQVFMLFSPVGLLKILEGVGLVELG